MLSNHFAGLDYWRNSVASCCVGNPLLVFAVSAAFASALVKQAGLPSFGFHFVGNDDAENKALLAVAMSVFGVSQNSAFVVMDYSAQAKQIAQSFLPVLGGVHDDCAIFLSGARQSLGAAFGALGGAASVRMHSAYFEILGQVNENACLFSALHGEKCSVQFSANLVRMASRSGGEVGAAFALFAKENAYFLPMALVEKMHDFLVSHFGMINCFSLPSMAYSFALVAVAGELATVEGLTGWGKGEALRAAGVCLDRFLG